MRKNTVIALGTVCALSTANAIPLPRFLFPHHAHDEIGSWFQELLALDEADMALAAEEQADYIPHTHIEHDGEEVDAPSEHDVLSHLFSHADHHDENSKHVDMASIAPIHHHEDHEWTHSHAGHGFDASSDFLDAMHKDHAKHYDHVLQDHHVASEKIVVGQSNGHVDAKEDHLLHSHGGHNHNHHDQDLVGHHEAHVLDSLAALTHHERETDGRRNFAHTPHAEQVLQSAYFPYGHHLPHEEQTYGYMQYQHDPLFASHDDWMHHPHDYEAFYHDAHVPAHVHGYEKVSPYAVPEHGYFAHESHGSDAAHGLIHGDANTQHDTHSNEHLNAHHDVEQHARHEASFAHQHLRNINSAFKHNHPREHGVHASAMGGAHDPLLGKTLFDVMLDASALPI